MRINSTDTYIIFLCSKFLAGRPKTLAAIDNQKGSRLSIGAGLTLYGHGEEVMGNWAKDLKKWVDQTHGIFSEKTTNKTL